MYSQTFEKTTLFEKKIDFSASSKMLNNLGSGSIPLIRALRRASLVAHGHSPVKAGMGLSPTNPAAARRSPSPLRLLRNLLALIYQGEGYVQRP
jgi:hypothetical protein